MVAQRRGMAVQLCDSELGGQCVCGGAENKLGDRLTSQSWSEVASGPQGRGRFHAGEVGRPQSSLGGGPEP